MLYTLSKDGDDWERPYWRTLEKAWPNYEVLWREFVVPLTGRPHDIQIRKGTDPLLEEMCMAHYSTFYHLGRAHELFRSVKRNIELARSYDEIFFHMSAATEMVDRFLFAIWKICRKIKGQAAPEPWSLEEVVKHAKRFHGKEYKKNYEEYLNSGRSVGIPLHNVRDSIDSIMALIHAKKLVKEMWQIADHIRSYRNVMTHNPLIGQLIVSERAIYLPKQDNLSKYPLWSSTLYGETVQLDYAPANDIVEDYLGRFESRVNELWQKLIELLREWSETEQYKAMLPPEPEEPTAAVRKIAGAKTSEERAEPWRKVSSSGSGIGSDPRVLPRTRRRGERRRGQKRGGKSRLRR